MRPLRASDLTTDEVAALAAALTSLLGVDEDGAPSVGPADGASPPVVAGAGGRPRGPSGGTDLRLERDR